MKAYKWYYINSEKQKIYIPFRKSHVHDSFAISLNNLLDEKIDPHTFLDKYISSEIRFLDFKDINQVFIEEHHLKKSNIKKVQHCIKDKKGLFCMQSKTLFKVNINYD